MVVKHRKKSARMRGSRTHGWGLVHRGSGNRGGFGNAGTGKRSHNSKPSIWGLKYFGKKGFAPKGPSMVDTPINLIDVDSQASKWVAQKLASVENGVCIVDLAKIGYDKLLGKGKLTKKFRISVEKAPEKVIQKAKKFGSEVILTKGE